MDERYREFIDQNYASYEQCYGRCHEASARMKESFPELNIVKGWVFCSWGRRDHSWLETVDGEKIDPTGKQFPGWPMLIYEAWQSGMEVCVGRCMNCGNDIYRVVQSLDPDDPANDVGDTSICSDECADDFTRSLNAEISHYRR